MILSLPFIQFSSFNLVFCRCPMLPRPAVPAAASPRAPVASNPRRGLAPPHVSPAARLGSGSHLRVHRRPLDSAPLPCVPPAGRLLAASACPSSARLRARCRLPPHAPRAPGRGQDRNTTRGTASWFRLLCESRNGPHVRLLEWSCSFCICLAGLRVELILEPLQEPCQRSSY